MNTERIRLIILARQN